VTRAFHIGRLEAIETLFGEERALDRALNFAGSIVVTASVLGHDQGAGLKALSKGGERAFPYVRTIAFAEGNGSRSGDANAAESEHGSAAEGAVYQTRHDRMRVESVVHVPVWDKARWRGVLYMTAEAVPPVMLLIFTDLAAADEIWLGWSHAFGKVDESERIRVSVVRQVDPEHPAWYRVVIGANPRTGSPGLAFALGRVLTVNPDSDINLERFLADYRMHGSYYLGVGFAPQDAVGPEDTKRRGFIQKKQLIVLNASDIGPNDLEVVALSEQPPEG